jgi:transglycosylase-like protein with SLT domain
MRRLCSWLFGAGAIAILAVTALPCFAGEVAVLKNGFTIQHERREVVGDVTRLYVSADGASFVDVPTTDIDHYEEAPDPPVSASEPESAPGQSAALRSSSFVKGGKGGAPGFPVPRSDLNQVVNEASGRYRLDPDLVNSVIKAESGFNARAVSPKGAQGLMQLMPGTASQLGVPNAFDPRANVDGGTRYLRELLERYNFDLVKALAAYNAGPQRVEQFGGVPPFHETRAYVARIVKDFNKKKTAQQKAVASSQKSTPPETSTAARKTLPKTPASGAKAQHPKAVTQAEASSSPSE